MRVPGGEDVPTYQYVCTQCGHHVEAVQSFSDDPLTVCQVCGGKLRKQFSSVGVVFKGSGFYRTDSRKGAAAAEAAAPAKENANGSKQNGGKDSGREGNKDRAGRDGGKDSGREGNKDRAGRDGGKDRAGRDGGSRESASRDNGGSKDGGGEKTAPAQKSESKRDGGGSTATPTAAASSNS
jgi:putative FmdB family regulatory protein